MTQDAFQDLLARARAGPGEAREELARLMTFEAHAVARRELGPKLRRRLESVDVTQSVVWRAVEKIDDFRGASREQLRAWLARQVVSQIRDYADHYGAQKRNLDREQPIAGSLDAAAPAPARQATPSAAAMTSERVEQLRAALRTLPGEDQLILERVKQGLSWAALAQEFSLPSADAARMRCVRLQNKLTKILARKTRG